MQKVTKRYSLEESCISRSLIFNLVWQEAFQNGQGHLDKKAIVHVWKKEDWQNVTLEVNSFSFDE